MLLVLFRSSRRSAETSKVETAVVGKTGRAATLIINNLELDQGDY